MLLDILYLGLGLDYIPNNSPISILYHIVATKEASLENNDVIMDILSCVYDNDPDQVINALLQTQQIDYGFTDTDENITVLSY